MEGGRGSTAYNFICIVSEEEKVKDAVLFGYGHSLGVPPRVDGEVRGEHSVVVVARI